MFKIKLLILLVLVVGAGGLTYKNIHNSQTPVAKAEAAAKKAGSATQSATDKINTVKESVNYCAKNPLAKNIVVSISKQHLWACEGASVKYDSPVVTGMESYPADLTPVGTYHIYGKQTDQTLTGSDGTGSWSDPVSYWEPFLYNEYGAYGFHDATWRADSDFGNIDINAPFTTTAKSASHGCVELPLATAKWIYDWSVIGTTVTIQG
ncbi:MAG TPA: L,D-transpeptidase [Candidatus Saccharimonadales bacterium]|nr:L,D-transpeptidase [Candidatus Saccharimonadales bacterium]